jgi:hypothetical protein
VQEILKPWVGPERIEDRPHEEGRIESRLERTDTVNYYYNSPDTPFASRRNHTRF